MTFPIPSVYFEWFTLFHRLHDQGVKVCWLPKGEFAFVVFDTPEEAVEFKLKYL